MTLLETPGAGAGLGAWGQGASRGESPHPLHMEAAPDEPGSDVRRRA